MKRILVMMLFLASASHIFAQSKISIRIDNVQDNMFYLLKYRGEKTYSVDTSLVKNGKIVFKSANSLDEGIYLLTNDKKQAVLQILIDKNQDFSIHVKDIMNQESISVKGSKETAAFYKIMAETERIKMNVRALDSELNYYPQNGQRIDSLKLSLVKFQKSFLTNDTSSFLNIFIKSLLEINLPDSLIDNKIESQKYFINHYWDNITLDDLRILTYPLIDSKLNTFFDYLLPPEPDIINEKIDYLISKTNDCQEVRDYLLWYFYSKYHSPKYMNLDPVFIHIVKRYFSNLSLPNLTESVRQTIISRVDHLSHLLLGTSAPLLIFPDSRDSLISLYDLKSPFTVIYFYNHDCQLCKREKRILNQLITNNPDIKIYAIDLHEDKAEWKETAKIGEKNWIDVFFEPERCKDLLSLYDIQTTPSIYVLDGEKRIIAKRIKAEQIEDFINIK